MRTWTDEHRIHRPDQVPDGCPVNTVYALLDCVRDNLVTEVDALVETARQRFAIRITNDDELAVFVKDVTDP